MQARREEYIARRQLTPELEPIESELECVVPCRIVVVGSDYS